MIAGLTFDFLANNLSPPEPRAESIWIHSVTGLSRLGLMENLVEGLELDVNNFSKSNHWSLPEHTHFIVKPTTFGGEFYLWGIGNGMINSSQHPNLPKELSGTNLIPIKGNIVFPNLKAQT
jgi:hypothetical protein